jgi:DNA-binding MarR family transcriptional regulator
MTSIQQQTPAPAVPVGQAVGQAEAALTRLLNIDLAERGVSRQFYLALQRLNSLGGHTSREAYERDLREWLDLDSAAAARLAAEVISAGLVAADGPSDGRASATVGGTVQLTAQGQALRVDILGAGRQLTGPILAAIDPGDLQTTIRTLEEITRRVSEIPVRPASEEATPS